MATFLVIFLLAVTRQVLAGPDLTSESNSTGVENSPGRENSKSSSSSEANMAFCKDLAAHDLFEECNEKLFDLDLRCWSLYRKYGGDAKCEVIQSYVVSCAEQGVMVAEDAWRAVFYCPKPSVLVTTPNIWPAGGSADVCVNLHNIHVPTEIKIEIINKDTNSIIVSSSDEIDESRCFQLPVDVSCTTSQHKLIVLVSNQFYKYSNEGDAIPISCSTQGNLLFIQTDKPIYKGGQTVHVRILEVSLPKLLPVEGDIPMVSVETPAGIKVLQKDNLKTTIGLGEFEFILDTQPPLGQWNVVVQNAAGTHKQEFTVDKFVLPKWDATIEAPSTVSANMGGDLKICAKYTYGEAVEGTYTLSVSTSYWSPDFLIETKVFTGSIDASGCTTVHFGPEDLSSLQVYYYVYAEVSVTETVSGISRTAKSAQMRIISDDRNMVFHQQMSPYFKLKSPIFGQLTVEDPNGKGSQFNISLELSISQGAAYTTVYTTFEVTDKQGVLEFTLPTLDFPKDTINAYIKASMKGVTQYHYLQAWYSSDQMYLTIQPPFKVVSCHCELIFPLHHNAERNTLFHYVIISKGHVVLSGSTNEPNKRLADSFALTIEINPTMSGSSTLIVYYITSSGEFVADYLKFDVEKCFENQVNFEFDSDQGKPGEKVTYTLSAATDSLCGIGVIDRSLEILAGNSFITKNQVFSALALLDLPYSWNQFDTTAHCKKQFGDEVVERKKREADAVEAVDKVDVVPEDIVEDDVIYEEEPIRRDYEYFQGDCYSYSYYWSNYVDSSIALNHLGVLVSSDIEVQTRPCQKYTYQYCGWRFPEMEPMPDEVEKDIASEGTAVDIRTFFPETFLWLLVVTPKRPVTRKVTLPDTISEFYGNAVCMNSDVGLGVSDFTSIITFKNFFIEPNLPYSIVRGETVHVPVLVFNYLNKGVCVAMQITLQEEDTFDIVGASSYTVCSCGQASQSVSFAVKPNVVGTIELTVVAVSVDSPGICETLSAITVSDGVTKQVIVIPEGIEKSYSVANFLCANDSTTYDLPIPNNVVNDSKRARITAIGDVMASALSNLDELIQMPMGCGEQTIFFMAQAAIVYNYLTITGQVTPEIQTKALTAMESGYQRELTFRHTNGGFSVWGPGGSSVPSNWLTSFAVRVFALSSKFIYIDPNLQSESINHIISGQENNGCFPQVGTVIHSDMTGGLQTGNQNIALTAIILISVIEAGIDLNSLTVQNAIRCIRDSGPVTDMTTYALAVSAYAFTLYGRDPVTRQKILDELDSRAIKQDGVTYWSDGGSQPQSPYYPPPSYDIEMTAYVLLALIKDSGNIGLGIPILRWLSSKRNALGGWSSTQDTYVGLLGLSEFGVLSSGDNLNVAVTSTPPGRTFNIDNSNKQILQTAPVDVPNTLNINIVGTGCALVQADVWYNVIPEIAPEPYFRVNLNVLPEANCIKQTLRMCVTYLHADSPTNMALVTVKMVTGWTVDEDSLPIPPGADIELEGGKLTKVEVTNDDVIFYFDKLNSEDTCFKFQVTQNTKVDDVKPGYITVTDYYAPAKTTSVDYTLTCE